ncbi:NAD(P)-dependent oxidoreductase [Exiguobacterium sp. RIT452]|uniref:NAD(P)-dependent oxidoreductase n=1 Tax=Exiguobacterium sp. RIT452 TaxID=2315552 RepID=UPI000E745D59|nr:NAD(P)-dependent oxidoreductase [Exiguobacterium sp. RIT452]RJO95771.1 NAD(P)-dependent oxidoreductase [Exiguobacterium sp. RIT452]
MSLGWIGLGHMGVPMALRLRRAGYSINVYNRTAEKTAPLVTEGAVKLATPRAVVEQSDIIFIMLADGPAVTAILEQEDGLLSGTLSDKLIVNLSTVSPEQSLEYARHVEQAGGTYLEAPVSGSVGVAEAGQLVLLLGGDEKAIAVCRPYFEVLGKESIHFGAHGNGSSAKLAINLLLALVGEGVAETLLLGEQSGLDKDKLLQLIGASGMNTPLFQGKQDMYRQENFPTAFPLRLMAKDLGLITEAATRLTLDLPLAKTAHTHYQQALKDGHGDADMAAIYLSLKNITP